MSAQQDNLMEELANRDFTPTEEDYEAVVYEKITSEGMESVTIFLQKNIALHERFNKSHMLISAFRYDTESKIEMTELINLTR
ncbi:MAG: hypothetical protein H9W81_07590 [Enterococcus sp.]|nr:hypothetical protein [Enterococcus sp.]